MTSNSSLRTAPARALAPLLVALGLLASSCGESSPPGGAADADTAAVLPVGPAEPFAPATPAVPPALTHRNLSFDERFVLSWGTSPDPIPLNEPFVLRLVVARADSPDLPDADATIDMSALMPEHGHGMSHVPAVTSLGDGEFLVMGLLFHMSGRWDLIVNVRSGRDFAQTVMEIEVSPPPVSVTASAAVEFSDVELRRILRASPLLPAPPDPTNAVADDPAAARLGQFLFFDKQLSADGTVGCVTCHQPERAFTDGRQLAHGLADLTRHSPALWNLAHDRYFFWDGRTDSLWSQALQPLEDAREHGLSREAVLARLRDDEQLARAYRVVFGPLPDTGDQAETDLAFVNVGKAIAAYVARLVSDRAPFDVFVEGLIEDDAQKLTALSPVAQRGLKRFMGSGNCHLCHSGPLFSDQEFHSTRVPPLTAELGEDQGRQLGVTQLLADPFNGIGRFSDDAGEAAHLKLDYIKSRVDNIGQFKTPSLRNVGVTAPYMHQGQFATLRDVLRHYSTFENAFDPIRNHFERTLVPLELTDEQMDELQAFLHSLTDIDIDPALLTQPASPLLAGA